MNIAMIFVLNNKEECKKASAYGCFDEVLPCFVVFLFEQ
ncbi:hypothetical protein PCARR_a3792 [Pseudoalteromonas carrageenovora IAM 12662]|uniref:Uncharacterized protein n=1 Tax=Pseudoalteromonas carrageenovora IAM 12662 TaxID=1314868 RepID=A0ABR9EXN7_PSEVC|nr:hypothetical protein [Pseudoalteromonas carrageenovora IAM 12662]